MLSAFIHISEQNLTPMKIERLVETLHVADIIHVDKNFMNCKAGFIHLSCGVSLQDKTRRGLTCKGRLQ
jgi:hypothetical protein